MAAPLVSDELWALFEALLLPYPPRSNGGRPPIPDRARFTRIAFGLKTGIQWEDLPQEMGCGSGMTCWRRLREWQEAGVWAALHRVLLERLEGAGQLDWRRAALDSASVPAKRGAKRPARTRRIGASRARSGTSSWTPEARRSA